MPTKFTQDTLQTTALPSETTAQKTCSIRADTEGDGGGQAACQRNHRRFVNAALRPASFSDWKRSKCGSRNLHATTVNDKLQSCV